jgi:predicted ATPase
MKLTNRLYIRGFHIDHSAPEYAESYLAEIPALRHFQDFSFQKRVTFFVGENGTGKSTILEALAVNAGFNPEGGSKNFNFATHNTHSNLYKATRIIRGANYPKDGFFS